MKKLILRPVVSLISAAIALAALSGCAAGESVPVDLVVVAGIGSNTRGYDASELYDKMFDLSYRSGSVTYIIGDATPSADYFARFDAPTDHPSDDTRKRRATTAAKKMIEEISAIIPDSEENDILGAISVAGSAAAEKDSDEIYVYSNLLSTSGYLDMRGVSQIENIDIDGTVESLRAEAAIPVLDSKNIRWTILGTSGAQGELTQKEKNILKELWMRIIEEGGGRVTFADSLSDAGTPAGLPKVTPVRVSDVASNIKEIPTIEEFNEEQSAAAPVSEPEPLADDFTVEISDTSISFEPNTAEISDKKSAAELLRPVSEKIKASGISITLIGSCSTYGDPDTAKQLSLERALAIKNILVGEHGIPDGNISCIGCGYDPSNPYFTPDTKSDGSFNGKESGNRKVVLTNSDNEKIAGLQGAT